MLADWALTDPDFWLALTPLWPLVGYMLRFCPCCQEPFCADGTFSDAEMADAGWTFGSVTYGGENENTYEIEQITDDGRPPPCREITVEHGASELDETSGIVVYNLLNSAVYDPSDREIDRMDFSIRIRAISTDNPQGGLLPVFAVISQGGTLYRTETLGFITSFPSQWMLVEAEGLTSDDFFEIVDDDETGLDEDSHPDWSTEGASMTFGFGTYQEGPGVNTLQACPPVDCSWLHPTFCALIYPSKAAYASGFYSYGSGQVRAVRRFDNSCGLSPVSVPSNTPSLRYEAGTGWIMSGVGWEGVGPIDYTNPCGVYAQRFASRGDATGILLPTPLCSFHCGTIRTTPLEVTHRLDLSGGSAAPAMPPSKSCGCCEGIVYPSSPLQIPTQGGPWGCCPLVPVGVSNGPIVPTCEHQGGVTDPCAPGAGIPKAYLGTGCLTSVIPLEEGELASPVFPIGEQPNGYKPFTGNTQVFWGPADFDNSAFYVTTLIQAGWPGQGATTVRLMYYGPANAFPDTPGSSISLAEGGFYSSQSNVFVGECTGFNPTVTNVSRDWWSETSCPRTPPPGHAECIMQELSEHHTTVGRFDQLCIKLHLACDGDIFDSQMESANYIGGSVRYGTTNTNSVERSHKEDEGHPAPCMQLDLLIGSSEGLDGIQAYQLRSSATFDPSLHHGLGSVTFEIAAKGISSGVSGVSSLPVFATLSQGGKFYRTAPLGTISVPGPWTVITAESLTEDDFFEMSSSEADGMIQNSHPDWRMSGGMMTFGFGTAQETSGASGHVIAQFDALCLSFTEYDSVAPAACPCYQFSLSASIDTDPVPLPPFFPQPPPSCPDGWCCAAPSSSWTFTQIASNPCYYCSQAESLSCRCGAVTTGLTNNCGDGQRQWVLVISPTIATPPFTGQIAYVRNLPGAGFLEYRCANFDWNADSNTFDRISDLVGCDSSALPSQLTLTCTNRG